jgi:hypothetical protein
VDDVGSKLLVVLMLLPLALAGCADAKKGKDADSATDTSTASAASLQAIITVSVNGTVAQAANGTVLVPLGEPALFNGSRSTGIVVTYAWTFGDNATSTDRAEEHLYAAPGLYNVTLTINGTGNLTSNTTVAVRVVGVPAGLLLFTQHVEVSGSIPIGNPNSPNTADLDYVDHVVPIAAADANGTAALATVARIHVSSSGLPANQVFVYWRSPDGADLATTGDIGDTSAEHDLLYEGPMPAGDYVLRVRLFAGVGADYTASVDVDYVTA